MIKSLPPFSCLFNFSLSLNFYTCHNSGKTRMRTALGWAPGDSSQGIARLKQEWVGGHRNSHGQVRTKTHRKKKSSALHENAPILSKNHARKAGVAVESGSDWLWDGKWKHSPLYQWHYPQSLLRYMAQKLIKGEI